MSSIAVEASRGTSGEKAKGNQFVAEFSSGRNEQEIMTQSAKAKTQEHKLDLTKEAISEISTALRALLADVFSLYMKTKNFHWHMTGRHFRDYHLLLDEHGEQIFAMTDDIAERARKIGGYTLRSIGDVARHQRLKDNDDGSLMPRQMLVELRDDSVDLTRFLRSAHEICAKYNDVATTSLIEVWIDQTERRTWFLNEIVSEV
jgi:starvation-inducible DNA-binding protein